MYHLHCWDLGNIAYPSRIDWKQAAWIDKVYDSLQLNHWFTPQSLQTTFKPMVAWLHGSTCKLVCYDTTNPISGDTRPDRIAASVADIKAQMAELPNRILGIMLDSEVSEDRNSMHNEISYRLQLPWWTDTFYRLGQFMGASRVSSWSIVQQGMYSHPLKVAVRTKMAHAYRRLTCPDAQIWAGPHLGHDYVWQGTTYRRPTPPDVLDLTMNLSLACGCQGATLWGQHTLLQPIKPEAGVVYFPELGQTVYTQLSAFKVMAQNLGNVTNWRPTPCRVAILYPDSYINESASQYNLSLAAMMLGEPVEIVFMRDVNYLKRSCEYLLCAWELSPDEKENFKSWAGTILDTKQLGLLYEPYTTGINHHRFLSGIAKRLRELTLSKAVHDAVVTELVHKDVKYLTTVDILEGDSSENLWWKSISSKDEILGLKGTMKLYKVLR